MTFGSKEENPFLGRDFHQSQAVSERTASEIDAEIRRFVNEGYQRARGLLSSNLAALHAVAQALLEREVLDSAEIDALMASPQDPAASPA